MATVHGCGRKLFRKKKIYDQKKAKKFADGNVQRLQNELDLNYAKAMVIETSEWKILIVKKE